MVNTSGFGRKKVFPVNISTGAEVSLATETTDSARFTWKIAASGRVPGAAFLTISSAKDVSETNRPKDMFKSDFKINLYVWSLVAVDACTPNPCEDHEECRLKGDTDFECICHHCPPGASSLLIKQQQQINKPRKRPKQ